ncbi:T9SS type A sorting domain-containing protein [Flavobacterium sp. MFBS3-15]|uniref:fibronectin type III domain-containing protein n=1 Tax=Flavobacterium sp. MFBS3-15 TaxID=2989816 RepID=UPI0022361C78|nr:T9SS type A sorting domain-containing protein [Flavobacterium sp. MFBS3-15]MCW4469904.1 T9SS type A sorting domain-containing protein [Flavobacterium sp. MFBS3-15]
MKQNYQKCMKFLSLLICIVIANYSGFGNVAAPFNTPCAGTGTAASEGTFSTGYSYEFSTTGTTVNVTATMLDTDKVGVVAYVRTQMPFTEAPMANAGGLSFTGTIAGQTPGATIGIAVKFAYAGGLVVTQYINYVVGENCTGGGGDTQAPTGFTATVGTVTATSVQLLLNGSDDSGNITYTITYGSNTTTATGTSGTQLPVVINNLMVGTAYTFSVTAADASGNAAANNPIALTATTQSGPANTACAGTATAASEGAFSTGYSYVFSTTGNTVNVSMTMLDTDKVGVIAYLRTQTPFSETPMANAGGLTFTGTIPGQTPGTTIGIAVKFAYAGGLVVTQYVNYVVGENCTGGGGDTQAPTGFTATAGTVTANSVQLLLNGTDDSGAVIYTITYGATTTTVNGTSGSQQVALIEGLTAGTAYTFTVTAADGAGNAAANNPQTVQATTLQNSSSVPCTGTGTAALDGTFTTGYSYSFQTVNGNVQVSMTMLDTDKVGVVAYLWLQAPFTETPMANAGGLTFTGTIPGQANGATIGIAVKFAYAGGQVVTQYINYVVGQDCEAEEDTEAPTGFTATAGTITANSIALVLNGTDNSGSVTYTITYGTETMTVTVASGETETVVIDELDADTDYTFTVTAADAAGNTAANPIVILATTAEESGGGETTPCSGTANAAQDGTFSTGYSYEFETVGNNVNVTITLLDTDKVGVVAYLWLQAPFAETPMANVEGLTFTGTIPAQTLGNTIGIAVKFAYAGGQVVTQYINYEVGENCGTGEEDIEAPTGFEISTGTVTATSIELELTASDNSGDVIYTITYEGGTSITVTGESGVTESVIINNLLPESVYVFTITVMDAAGNMATNVIELQAATIEDTNTECEGMSTTAENGSFSTGYTYHFETVGNDVVVTVELLDTDKVGVVGYVWLQDPFTEIAMTQGEGLSFSATVPGLTTGQDVNIAVKFAYAGGQAVTQYFTYTVGEECSLGIDRPELGASVRMFPNPATDIVHFVSETADITKVEIYSVLGSKVMEADADSVTISALPKGMYIARIYAGSKSTSKKLIVE